MAADADRPSDLGALLRRLAPDLDRLARALRDLHRCRCGTIADGVRVPAERLERITVWSRAYDAVHAAGVRPLRPDGTVLEIRSGARRVIVERGATEGAGWIVRERPQGALRGPLAGRIPGDRVV
jgi:hypothetical protein